MPKDTRTLREKLEDVIKAAPGAVTEGERANALSLMEKKGWLPKTRPTATGTRRPLTREEILQQAAENFNVGTDDLKAAFDYMSQQAKRATEATRKAAEANARYAEEQRALRTCQYCKQVFASIVYRQGHASFCEANPANFTYDPKSDPDLARCMFCGSMVPPERIAVHQNRCPQRPTSTPRFSNGQRTTRTGRVYHNGVDIGNGQDATFNVWFDEFPKSDKEGK
jgi:hypothetical protein